MRALHKFILATKSFINQLGDTNIFYLMWSISIILFQSIVIVKLFSARHTFDMISSNIFQAFTRQVRHEKYPPKMT